MLDPHDFIEEMGGRILNLYVSAKERPFWWPSCSLTIRSLSDPRIFTIEACQSDSPAWMAPNLADNSCRIWPWLKDDSPTSEPSQQDKSMELKYVSMIVHEHRLSR